MIRKLNKSHLEFRIFNFGISDNKVPDKFTILTNRTVRVRIYVAEKTDLVSPQFFEDQNHEVRHN